jgi:hypothetical protein
MEHRIFKNLLNKDEIEELINEFNQVPDSEVVADGVGAKNVYNLEGSIKYHIKFQKILEHYTGNTLERVNSFMRKYSKGEELKKHKDRKDLDYTLSIQLKKSDNIPNPLTVHEKDKDIELYLENGDGGLLVKGNEKFHSRPPLESDYMYNLFLHYKITTKERGLI